jgi:uncharacterized membrane protein
MQGAYALLFLSYPFLMHACILFDRVDMAVYVLAGFTVLPLFLPAVRRGMGMMNYISLLLLAGLILLIGLYFQRTVVVMPPILIFSALGMAFALSLRPPAIPVVTRLAEIIRGEMPADVAAYTRRVTLVWALFFGLMALVSVLLAMFVSLEVWSLFSNFIAWGLIALMFVAEFMVRRRLLANHVDYSFLDFLRNLSRVDLRHVMK